ncbi:hypothetical protein ACN42_g2957 [Penicillium freii]|uniref:Major facilitator superfamily (MFS) profile domain-containing protein n=1 Tax=Penicillium freii TaxID=48697 RepID=A0A101MP73_PENFR|nr:hypothetical protein ACN42_g2957 [Penicillium freii]
MRGIFQALGEMGPGVSTFLCASESFPTPLRGHFLEFAAAVGKTGASIGTEVFTPIQNSFDTTAKGHQSVFLIGAASTVVGGLVAWFLIPDMSRELETEDTKFRTYLEENGYGVSLYGEALTPALRLNLADKQNSAFRIVTLNAERLQKAPIRSISSLYGISSGYWAFVLLSFVGFKLDLHIGQVNM